MKKRIFSALVLFFALLFTLAGAYAAGDATKIPTVSIQSVPRKGIRTGRSGDIAVKASVPGFLDLWLTDATGTTVRTFYSGAEVHSLVNYFNITALDDHEEKLVPGDYTLNASIINQYGVSSQKVATKKLTIQQPSEDDEDVSSALLTAENASAIGLNPSAGYTSPSSPSNVGSQEAFPSSGTQSTPSFASPSSDLGYTVGSSITIGSEGYQIGVGVSDRSAIDSSYWSLTASSPDEEIWRALIQPITYINVDEKESAYIYDSPDNNRKQIGTVSGLSQGLHVVMNRTDGWSLVEAFRNEDGCFVRGYVSTNRLKTSEVNGTYGIVIDKATQTLSVYMNGQKIGSCLVSTGLATSRYLSRETPAGEFMTVTRRGTLEYYNTDNWCKYAIRINGSYSLMEIPTTRKGGSDYSPMLSLLGMKSTRGSIVIAHDPSLDGSINAEWIWNLTDKNKKIKVLIFDDKPRYSVPLAQ